MAAQPKISKRLEAWVDSDTRFRARAYVQQDRIRPEQMGSGYLNARAHGSADSPYEVWVRLKGTDFSYHCSCSSPRETICKHIYATVLLAESIGIEGFRRRVLQQSTGEDEVVSAQSLQQPLPPTLGARRPGRVARFEVEGLDLDRTPLRIALVQWWRRPDGELLYRSPGWEEDLHREVDALSARAFQLLLELPWEGVDELSVPYSARRRSLRSGTSMGVAEPDEAATLEELARTGHAVRAGADPGDVLHWSGREYRVVLRPIPDAEPAAAGESEWQVELVLQHAGREIPLASVQAVTRGGVVLCDRELGVLQPPELAELVATFRNVGAPRIPESELRAFLGRMWRLPAAPEIDLPVNLTPTSVRVPPRGEWVVDSGASEPLRGRLRFRYGATTIEADDARPRVLDEDRWQSIERDALAEDGLRLRLADVLDGFREGKDGGGLAADRLAELALALEEAGFQVWTEEQRLRSPRQAEFKVGSGIDWFDVESSHEFGDGLSVSLPRLLRALQKEQETVLLDDGSAAIVPRQWLNRVSRLLQLGEAEGEALRFQRSQAVWVAQLLESAQNDAGFAAARSDEAFQRVDENLRQGREPRPADPADSFQGALRPYQREGLGWLRFLAEVGFGGILADDMGLGKTIQVLAHLHLRRRDARAPALVVAPRSVVHQWKFEAQRFLPELEVMAHVGPDRTAAAGDLGNCDLVVTSYGVLRRDVPLLETIEWDLLVLDEAQAVKNATTVTARAARQLRARQRLVVTGTPIENHLGELANHLDFLNPGLFGRASSLRERFTRRLDSESANAISRALQPLLLRRTKDQVAADLPERVEQELLCEMEGQQRQLYGELRDHFARSLLPQARAEGLPRMQVQVLTALLRLRQAACHPGLVDAEHRDVASAKFGVLLPRLEELIEEGSKALVFSQFTQFLGLLKPELDRRGIAYENLDGSTTDRERRIRRFQEDPQVPLFLISLKAGGVGLNLTAAQYVFLLDPWWNPAVEAQAIDRTHRHGQTRRVMAYRLITRGTVEEKVRQLQDQKRAIAEAILGEQSGGLRQLSTDDLEVLLGG